MKNGLLKKIEFVLSHYLGIEQEEIHPAFVQLISNKIVITNTSAYRRHKIRESWENFSNFSMSHTTQPECGKLGIALGKAIAKNLVVTFDSIQIKEDNS